MTQVCTNINIDITFQDNRWTDGISNIDAYINDVISKALEDRLPGINAAEISIVLADDAFIHDLNKTYRGKDKPTNVLSFPMTDSEELKNPVAPFCVLGDIIIAFETIKRESEEQEKKPKDHFTHMLVHGCLHLLHYNHQNDKDAEEMETFEIEILKRMGIKNPYE
ncbi:MAG: rRNA maturation RNase YbeY [Alphaproteobacteria bacterium]|nr:rRNA maturation RNase YbeY [Alphaproteobacteria bacterium]